MHYAPGAEEIERLARAAIAAMPPIFREHLHDIPIFVEEFAEQSVLDDLGIEDPWELSGLYEGRPLTEASIWSSGELPSRIRLYRRPLLEEWVDTGVSLEDLITHVLVHEVGHHFGFSDEDMHGIEEGMRGG